MSRFPSTGQIWSDGYGRYKHDLDAERITRILQEKRTDGDFARWEGEKPHQVGVYLLTIPSQHFIEAVSLAVHDRLPVLAMAYSDTLKSWATATNNEINFVRWKRSDCKFSTVSCEIVSEADFKGTLFIRALATVLSPREWWWRPKKNELWRLHL